MKHHTDTSDLDRHECCQEGAMRRASADADAPDLYCDPNHWGHKQGRAGEASEDLPSLAETAWLGVVAVALTLVCIGAAAALAWISQQ